LDASAHILRVISLRSESSTDETFELMLRSAGHKVTVLSSTEPAFALVSTSWPDVVLFDPISQFGMSGAIQRLRSSFDGVIVAAGNIPDPTISAMLEELGIAKFASTASELLVILKNVPTRVLRKENSVIGLPAKAPKVLALEPVDEQQLELLAADSKSKVDSSPEATQQDPEVSVPYDRDVTAPERSSSSIKLPSLRNINISLPMKRWHRTAIGTAVVAAVIIAVAIPFFGHTPVVDDNKPVAKALPVVPNLLTSPLAPLTLEELSGETLPLEIAGIKERAVVEKPAVAFWGDTAPDAFVTVNGEPVDVSEYGAFVVDYPLDDGANFIEVLASDFQGRTTRQSFTIVSLQ
jgi:hypothetical protein